MNKWAGGGSQIGVGLLLLAASVLVSGCGSKTPPKSTTKAKGVLLKNVSFSGDGFRSPRCDIGSQLSYDDPHWVDQSNPPNGKDDPEDEHDPVAYKRDTKMKLKAQWRITGKLSDNPSEQPEVWARAFWGDALYIDEVKVNYVDNNTALEMPETLCEVKLPDKIMCYDEFTIEWELKIGDRGWGQAGQSKSPVYVTLIHPPYTFHTVFYVSCKNAHAMTASDTPTHAEEVAIANAVWTEFTDLRVERKDNPQGTTPVILHYWKNVDLVERFTTDVLLKEGDGKCGAWGDFFIDCLKAQGIDDAASKAIVPITPGAQGIVVNNWTFSGNGVRPSDPDQFFYVLGVDVQREDGINAQGENNIRPHSRFTNHCVVKYNNEYYDPSYGKTASSPEAWESVALAGTWKVVTYGGNNAYGVRKNNPLALDTGGW